MLIVEVRGDQVWRRVEGQGSGAALPAPELPGRAQGTPTPDVLAALASWAERYGRAAAAGAEVALRGIGEEIFGWLDQGGALASWLAGPERVLEVRVDPLRPGPLAEALLAAPWEALCRDGGFLAEEVRLFVVARRCGGSEAPAPARHSDLSLMFMAAAPEDQSELDYEAEEAAILEATRAKDGRAPLAHVQVEESGALEFLAERMRLDGPFEALHLSCHGDILASDGAAPSPILLLETAAGDGDAIAPERLIGELANGIPPLVFVSACRTAERGAGRKGRAPAPEGHKDRGLAEAPAGFEPAERREDGGTETGGPPELAEPFVRQLAVHVPNVLGWDGSVYDRDATLFAEALYGELAHGETVPRAAARARRELFAARAKDPRLGRHWHLARVYLGPGGGGPLCDPQGDPRPARPDPELPFLDPKNRRVPVATRAEFVGRRRKIQEALAAYRGGRKGVLVHGMGNLGKSSLAARVAARMPRHRTAVVFGRCHALAVFGALKGAIEEVADGMALNEAKVLVDEVAALETEVTAREAALGEALRRLLRGTLNTHPVLLILDDLEQSLETPAADRPEVQPAAGYRDALAAVLAAFGKATTASRLLLTSRYDFVLPDGAGGDLAAGLVRVPLAPMGPRERQKQVRAKARAEGKEETEAAAPETIEAALAAAAGNPGLQDTLTRPILAGEAGAAAAAIATVEAFRATGKQPPAGEDPGDFFKRMAFGTYTGALSGAERVALSAATLFSLEMPIPRPALEAAAAELGLADPARALDRLLALGLLDDWGVMSVGRGAPSLPHAALNPLARPLADPLSEAVAPRLAAAALAPLGTGWRAADGDFPYDPRAVEVTQLALLAGAPEPALLEAAAAAAVFFLFRRAHDARAAVALARPVLDALDAAGHPPGAMLLGHTINAAAQSGDVELQDRLLEKARGRDDIEPGLRAQLLCLHADRLVRLGDLAEARRSYDEALPVFETLNDSLSVAITKGKIADILQSRGELAEALRIRTEEQLPVFERLGDVRAVAITKGQIADILQSRGELAEALRIRTEEQLPVFERLGDVRAVAITKGKIADILQSRGELAEALRIRTEEQLPVYERLGDVRAVAITKGKIADILQSRGELAEALRIRTEEELPVYERLGDVRAVAITKGKIADILQSRGELAEALRIRTEEELPVYERLGDVRAVAITKGQIADILQSRGELAEALRIRTEEQLPVYERLGDVRAVAITKGQIADILQSRGELAEALRIRTEEQLPVLERLGDVRAVAIIKGKIADILQSRGELAEALAMHLGRLPVAREMQDIDAVAHTLFSCAQIRLSRGDHEKGDIQTIFEELSEAFQINLKLQRPDGIGATGNLLGQVLALGGHSDEAVGVLETAAAAFDKIGQADAAVQCRQVIEQIGRNAS